MTERSTEWELRAKNILGCGGKTPQEQLKSVCDLIGNYEREYHATNRKLQEALKRVGELEHDIHAYRGALGYAVPGEHNGKLSNGEFPICGICDANQKDIYTLKSTVERMREEVISHYACYTYEKQHYLEEILMKYLEFTEEDVRLYYQRRDEKLSQQEGEK